MRCPLFMSLAFVSACSGAGAAEPRHALRVRVDSDPGEGLAGVPLYQDGKRVGATGPEGVVTLRLPGRDGQRSELRADCPSTHRTPAPETVVLRSYQGGHVPELALHCPPRTRKLAVVVVATNGNGLPLRHRGKELARTDTQGVAHVQLEGDPGDRFQLVLDTQGRPELTPQNPPAEALIAARDSAFLFDPQFKVTPPPKPRRPQRLGWHPTRLRF